MVPANIRYPRNWTWAFIFAGVERWLVVGSGIYRYNEVSLVSPSGNSMRGYAMKGAIWLRCYLKRERTSP